MATIKGKSLEDFRKDAKKDYSNTPLSVKEYIESLEEYMALLKQ